MMQIIEDITKFIFVRSELEPADVILLPGAPWAEIAEAAAELYHEGAADLILASGKYGIKRGSFANERVPETYRGHYETECEYLKAVLARQDVPEDRILLENESMNTMENAVMSKRRLEEQRVSPEKIIVCCQAFHARRILMTYSLVFDEAEILIYPVETQGISAANWHRSDYGIKRVMGELERCGKYFTDLMIAKK